MQEMPPTMSTDSRLCTRCRGPANYRCRACWALYCSSECKKRDSATHIFTCRIPNRPNDVDFLRLTVRKFCQEINSKDAERFHNALVYIFADDHLCRTFGFNNCAEVSEVLNLVCLYDTLFRRVRPAVPALQEELEAGTLGHFVTEFCELEREVARLRNTQPCGCVSWFLRYGSSEAFPIPSREKEHYDIWVVAWNRAVECLGVEKRVENEQQFTRPQRDVINLYMSIQPSLWRIPDATSPTWIQFGFCHCKSFSQKLQLAGCYLALACSGATFDDIVSAYETSSLAVLMQARGVDISALESQGILPCRPNPCEYSVFRLMISVEHALSGRFCDCFRLHQQRECHRPFETHLARDSDTNFGFHLTSSWEKWQLLNFYKYIFRQPNYDVRRMLQATEDADLDALETYLDTLDPGMRKRLHVRHRANLLFPRLKDRMRTLTMDGSVVHAHLPCECKLHEVIGPPGLYFCSLEGMLSALGFGNEEDDMRCPP
ncbi:HIT/MYND zinc finger-like protein [Cordyceps javanica]|nr:HIT/MYND zinc finger-like protein [Cordyceps javanica]